MTIHTKTALIIIGTLLIGMVLGALLTGAFVRHRFQRLADLRTSRGFMQNIERVIEPTDADQREAVRAVLRRGAQRTTRVRQRCRQRMRRVADSMRAELAPLLTDEQQARLQERLGRIRERFPPPPPPRRRPME